MIPLKCFHKKGRGSKSAFFTIPLLFQVFDISMSKPFRMTAKSQKPLRIKVDAKLILTGVKCIGCTCTLATSAIELKKLSCLY